MTDVPGEPGDTDSNPTPPPQPHGQPPGQPPAQPPLRRVTRSRDDRVLGGVAAGIARAAGVDPIVVRLGFVFATVLAGVGVLAYLAGWLLIPEAPDPGPTPTKAQANVRQIAGFAVLGIGLLVVLGNFDLWIDERAMWALGLIAIGGGVLWVRGRDARDAATAEHAEPGEPAPAAVASWQAPTSSVPPAAWTPPGGAPARRPRGSASLLGLFTLCALAIWVGVAAGLHALGAVDVGAGFVLSGALIVVGIALVVGARWGRARWLVAPGIALALVATAWGALDLPLDGGIGERNYHPTTFAVLEDEYELGLGSLHLDLRDLDFTGRTETVRVTVGVGEVNVWVPDDVRAVVDGEVRLGELRIFGGNQGGGRIDERVVREGNDGAGELRLELQGGLGSVKVLDEAGLDGDTPRGDR